MKTRHTMKLPKNDENQENRGDSDQEEAIQDGIVVQPRRSTRLQGQAQIAISDSDRDYAEPTIVHQALTGPEREQWLEAIRGETRTLRVNYVWECHTSIESTTCWLQMDIQKEVRWRV